MPSFRVLNAIAQASMLELFRRKDVYVALLLAAAIVVPLSSISLFGVDGVVRYIREIALLLIWVFSVAVSITNAARQVPGEIQRRTILPLLAKPIRRGEFVLGKFFGAWLASGLAVLIFYLCYVLLVALRAEGAFSWAFLQAVILHLVFVALLTAMTLFGSMILTPSANIACCALISVGMLLFGQQLPRFAADISGIGSWVAVGVHLIAPHFEFFDLRLRVVHEWGAMNPAVFLGVLAYAAVYAALLLTAAVAIFNRKHL